MRFCFVSTFYPPYHFGGDAVYVQRLATALARRGHSVDVIHDLDAYYLGRRSDPTRGAPDHPNITVHRLKSAFGGLSPFLTQQTARPLLKPDVRRLLESGSFDVVHFHNPSLIGSASFAYGQAVKLYTLHEHWLVCPTHVLWKFGREACDRPECFKCVVQARRPPQLWRYTGRLQRDLHHIDRLIAPSRFTRDRHLAGGITRPITVLPHFVPEMPPADGVPPHPRPYFLFAGRLVKLKGVDSLLRAFRRFRAADLLIAGSGEEADALRASAADLPHVHFLGSVREDELSRLYRHAIALVMPSVGYEVFGLVIVEAFAAGTPAVVRNLGGMPELIEDSGGGLTFQSDDGLESALERLYASPDLRRSLGAAAQTAYRRLWTEDVHVERYLRIVDEEHAKKSRAF